MRRSGRTGLDTALGGRHGPAPVQDFLREVAPDAVLAALEACLPSGGSAAGLRLLRTKVKPGRSLQAWYAFSPAAGTAGTAGTAVGERHAAATWVPAGTVPPGPALDLEVEARRRGVLAPLLRAWAGSADGRMSVRISPVDAAFPQLVRLHDPGHVAATLQAAGFRSGDGHLGVATVRYRPGERHVLRVRIGAAGDGVLAKVYRDDTGRQAVRAARCAAVAFAAAGDTARAVALRYVPAERVSLAREVSGRPLSDLVAAASAESMPAVAAAGSALRLLHEAGEVRDGAADLPDAPDATAHARQTVRAAQHIDVLLPATGTRLRQVVDGVLRAVAAEPGEAATMVHGDYKCDNILVDGSAVHVLDFDRCGRGDPAADVGKFLADLRWCSDGDGPRAEALHEAFLAGYGATDPHRVARARRFDALFQLRLAARRTPLQERDWSARVTLAVERAAATLARSAPP